MKTGKRPAPKVAGSLRHRVGSKWTAVEPLNREKHFEVEEVRRAKASESSPPPILLRALLSNRRIEVEARELADETRWKPGWL